MKNGFGGRERSVKLGVQIGRSNREKTGNKAIFLCLFVHMASEVVARGVVVKAKIHTDCLLENTNSGTIHDTSQTIIKLILIIFFLVGLVSFL